MSNSDSVPAGIPQKKPTEDSRGADNPVKWEVSIPVIIKKGNKDGNTVARQRSIPLLAPANAVAGSKISRIMPANAAIPVKILRFMCITSKESMPLQTNSAPIPHKIGTREGDSCAEEHLERIVRFTWAVGYTDPDTAAGGNRRNGTGFDRESPGRCLL
jgi:hypothetical protein